MFPLDINYILPSSLQGSAKKNNITVQHQLLHEMENTAQCLSHSLEQHIWDSFGLGDQQVVMPG